MRTTALIAAITVSGALFLGAGKAGVVTVKGSDTMVILAQRWAERYMKKNPSKNIQVTGGGSGVGFASLINGTTDICTASRPIKAAERQKIKEKYQSEPVETKTAIDGISVFINEANPLNEISFAQLKGIYTGAITNWKELGGDDRPIITYGRENSSGTFEFFREHVLNNEDYGQRVQSLPGTAAIVNAVVKDKYGIGYGGAAYGKGIKMLKVKQAETDSAIAPTLESVRAGEYPISRFLFLYTAKEPAGDIKQFIDWAISAEGQKIVAEVGYFPLQ